MRELQKLLRRNLSEMWCCSRPIPFCPGDGNFQNYSNGPDERRLRSRKRLLQPDSLGSLVACQLNATRKTQVKLRHPSQRILSCHNQRSRPHRENSTAEPSRGKPFLKTETDCCWRFGSTKMPGRSRLLILAKFLESWIPAQRVPDRVQPQKRWCNNHWRHKEGVIVGC